MVDKLEAIVDRYHQMEESLADPEVLSDMTRYAKISKQYKDLKAIVEIFHNYKSASAKGRILN